MGMKCEETNQSDHLLSLIMHGYTLSDHLPCFLRKNRTYSRENV